MESSKSTTKRLGMIPTDGLGEDVTTSDHVCNRVSHRGFDKTPHQDGKLKHPI